MPGLVVVGGIAVVALVAAVGLVSARRSRVREDPRNPELARAQEEIRDQIARGRSGSLR